MTSPSGTTSSKAARPRDVRLAIALAAELNGHYIPRRRRTVVRLLEEEGLTGVVVVSQAGPLWRDREGGTFFFHPNMAVNRVRSMARQGVADPLVRAAGIEPGDRVLDATLGLGADAIVLSAAAGPTGLVVGLEVSPVMAALVRHGLATYQHRSAPAMQRIEVIRGDYRDHILGGSWLARASWQVICFDPMFTDPVPSSTGIEGLRRLACYDPLGPETIAAARTLVTRAVVVKGRRDDGWLESLAPDGILTRRGRIAYAVFEPSSPRRRR